MHESYHMTTLATNNKRWSKVL